MTRLGWMIGASLVAWLGVTAAAPGDVNPELLFGMLGPLASAGIAWMVTERVHAAAPERVTAVMIMAFMGKMLFFAVYVIVMLKVLALRPMLFVVSFTTSFIVLFALQALFLRRLFDAGTPAS